jgi:hypothetical protein
MKVLHLEERFHPGMGYQINFFARYHQSGYEFSILTSDSARLWTASGDHENLKRVDEEFEREYNVNIHSLPSVLGLFRYDHDTAADRYTALPLLRWSL